MDGNRISSGMGSKPSKASLTSVSPCRKNPDKSMPKSILRQTQLCYRMSDVVISLLLIFPLVIGFWRGVWNLMEYYSELLGMGPWLCIGLGYSIPFFLYWLQEPLRKHVRPRKMNFILFYCISRYLLLLHSFGSVNQWRGLWQLMDLYAGVEFYSGFVSLCVGVVLSVCLKTFCNVLAPPLYVAVDEAYAIHDCPLRFHTKPKFKLRYFLDCIVSVFVTASLIVACWRGLWALADLYLYPEDPMQSALASLCFGYFIVLLLFICQPYIHKSMERMQGSVHLVVANMVTFVGFVGCVFAWRGLWMLYDELLGKFNWSDWATLIIGAGGSLILGCVSTIIVRGVAVDGEMAEDGTTEWPIPYVSLLRDSIYDVPFPEPWLFRYLCTSQKMNCQPSGLKDSKLPKDKKGSASGSGEKDGSGIPLHLSTLSTSSPTQEESYTFPTTTTTASILQGNLNSPLTNLRNIDSSSGSESDDNANNENDVDNIEMETTSIVLNSSKGPRIRPRSGNHESDGEGIVTRSGSGSGSGSGVKVKVRKNKNGSSSDSFELRPLRKINNGDVENSNVSSSNVTSSNFEKNVQESSTFVLVEGEPARTAPAPAPTITITSLP